MRGRHAGFAVQSCISLSDPVSPPTPVLNFSWKTGFCDRLKEKRLTNKGTSESYTFKSTPSCHSSELSDTTVGRRRAFQAAATFAASFVCDTSTKPALANGFILCPPERLNNRYFLVRSGEGYAEEAGILISNPIDKYAEKYGLTREGEWQARRVAEDLRDMGLRFPGWVWSSNFRPSYETGSIVREQLGFLWSEFRVDDLLDPRMMGAYDKGDAALRSAVWQNDQADPHSAPPLADPLLPGSAESAYDLFRRCVEFVSKIETMYQDSDIIVVSHDDVLSVLQTALLEGPASLQKHRQYAMKPAEIRLIDLT